jgi:hypothetical protein
MCCAWMVPRQSDAIGRWCVGGSIRPYGVDGFARNGFPRGALRFPGAIFDFSLREGMRRSCREKIAGFAP